MTFLKPTAIATVCVLCAGMAQASTFTFSATLDGLQEVPDPVTTDAFGVGELVLDDSNDTLSVNVDVTGIVLGDLFDIITDTGFNAGPLHIHNGVAGANGPVVVPFNTSSDFTATADGFNLSVTDLVVADFDELLGLANADSLYFNVHTISNTGGEIRGQLAAVPLPASILMLFGALGGLGALRRKKV